MEPARKRGALAGSSEPAPIGPDDLVNDMVEYIHILLTIPLEILNRSTEPIHYNVPGPVRFVDDSDQTIFEKKIHRFNCEQQIITCQQYRIL